MEAPELDAASPKSPASAPEDRSTLGTGRNAVEVRPRTGFMGGGIADSAILDALRATGPGV
jgi:hypothetical protein